MKYFIEIIFAKGSKYTTFIYLTNPQVLYEIKRISPKGQKEWVGSYQD